MKRIYIDSFTMMVPLLQYLDHRHSKTINRNEHRENNLACFVGSDQQLG